jgi:hypothetical protein
VPFTSSSGPAGEAPDRQPRRFLGCLSVGADRVPRGQFVQCPVLALALRLLIPWQHRDADPDGITLICDRKRWRAAEGRYRAVDEAMQVLHPGGQLLVADFWPMARKYAAHIGQGRLRGLGPGYW